MQDNIIDRDELQANYINRILDGMDIKDMMAILYDQFDDNLDKYSVDELIEEVNEYYPDLLDWSTQTHRVFHCLTIPCLTCPPLVRVQRADCPPMSPSAKVLPL